MTLEAFAVGDGVTKTFNLPHPWDAGSTPQFWKTDWQGRQLQYATPRTNGILYSEQLNNAAGWGSSLSLLTILPDNAAAPNSEIAAETLICADTSSQAYLNRLTSLAKSEKYQKNSIFVEPVVGEYMMMVIWNGVNVVRANIHLPSGASNIIYSGSAGTLLLSAVKHVAVGDFYKVILETLNPTGLSLNHRPYQFSVGINDGGFTNKAGLGLTANVWGADYRSSDIAMPPDDSYIKSEADPATITDYTLDEINRQITFAAAPLAGALLEWDYQYTEPVETLLLDSPITKTLAGSSPITTTLSGSSPITKTLSF